MALKKSSVLPSGSAWRLCECASFSYIASNQTHTHVHNTLLHIVVREIHKFIIPGPRVRSGSLLFLDTIMSWTMERIKYTFFPRCCLFWNTRTTCTRYTPRVLAFIRVCRANFYLSQIISLEFLLNLFIYLCFSVYLIRAHTHIHFCIQYVSPAERIRRRWFEVVNKMRDKYSERTDLFVLRIGASK